MASKLVYLVYNDWAYDLRKWREDVTVWIAWRLPRYLVYWCAIRVMSHATTGKYGREEPDKVTISDVLKRWEYER